MSIELFPFCLSFVKWWTGYLLTLHSLSSTGWRFKKSMLNFILLQFRGLEKRSEREQQQPLTIIIYTMLYHIREYVKWVDEVIVNYVIMCALFRKRSHVQYYSSYCSGTSDKGHNRNNLRTKDKVQCTKWRLSSGPLKCGHPLYYYTVEPLQSGPLKCGHPCIIIQWNPSNQDPWNVATPVLLYSGTPLIRTPEMWPPLYYYTVEPL